MKIKSVLFSIAIMLAVFAALVLTGCAATPLSQPARNLDPVIGTLKFIWRSRIWKHTLKYHQAVQVHMQS